MAFRFTMIPGAPPSAAVPGDGNTLGPRPRRAPPLVRAMLLMGPLLVALVGAMVYLALATRTYTGATSMLIEMRTGAGADASTAVPDGSVDPATAQDQARLVTSDDVLRRTVMSENLEDDPEFGSNNAGLGHRLLRSVGLDRQPASTPDRVAQATVSLASHVVVARSAGSPLLQIEVTSVDPAKAAHLSDAVARAYLAIPQMELRPTAEQDGDIAGTAAELRQSLQDAELKLAAFKKRHGLPAKGDGQALVDAASRLSQARDHAAELKAQLDDIKRAKSAGLAMDALPDTVESPLLDKLRLQYADLGHQQATLRQTLGERHPAMVESEQQLRDVRRLIGQELNRIQAGAVDAYRSAQADADALEARVQVLKQAASTSDDDRRRLEDLQREVDLRQAAYERRVEPDDGGGAGADAAPNARIVTRSAVPTIASSPRTSAVLAVSLAMGIVLGLILMFAAETIAASRQPASGSVVPPARDVPPGQPATQTTGPPSDPATPVLGAVPSPFGNPGTLLTRDGVCDRFRTAWPTEIEAEHVSTLPRFRTAMHALMLDDFVPPHADGAPRTVLVTSLDGADSRTAFALGFAEAAAGQGQRSIVIDADEQGSLLRELVAVSSRPILIDLMGTSRVCYRVLSPLRGSLSIVPIMAGEATVVRRLGAQGMAARIDGLAANFDLIIFDGPRIGGDNRLDAMAATVDAVLVTAPRSASQRAIDGAVAALGLPRGTRVSAVLLADLADGAATSAAA